MKIGNIIDTHSLGKVVIVKLNKTRLTVLTYNRYDAPLRVVISYTDIKTN